MTRPDCSQQDSETISLSRYKKYEHLNMDGWVFMYPVRVRGKYPKNQRLNKNIEKVMAILVLPPGMSVGWMSVGWMSVGWMSVGC